MTEIDAETILLDRIKAHNPDNLSREGWNCDMTALKTYLMLGDEYTAERTVQRAKRAAKTLSKDQLAKVETVVVAELRAKRRMNVGIALSQESTN